MKFEFPDWIKNWTKNRFGKFFIIGFVGLVVFGLSFVVYFNVAFPESNNIAFDSVTVIVPLDGSKATS